MATQQRRRLWMVWFFPTYPGAGLGPVIHLSQWCFENDPSKTEEREEEKKTHLGFSTLETPVIACSVLFWFSSHAHLPSLSREGGMGRIMFGHFDDFPSLSLSFSWGLSENLLLLLLCAFYTTCLAGKWVTFSCMSHGAGFFSSGDTLCSPLMMSVCLSAKSHLF